MLAAFVDFFITRNHGFDVGRTCVAEGDQVQVHDQKTAKNDEHQDVNGVDDPDATEQVNQKRELLDVPQQ